MLNYTFSKRLHLVLAVTISHHKGVSE